MPDSAKAQQYLQVQVKTASQDQLLLMLLDGAVRFVEGALERLAQKDREGKNEQVLKAQKIILELIQSLNPSVGEKIYANLIGLYKFIYRRLVEGNLRDDRACLEEGLKILGEVRETWRQAVSAFRAEAATAARAEAPAGISLQA
jgi:flagellar secretion chaperone FliS